MAPKNDGIVPARSRENGIHIVFVHPAEFLVTAPNGAIITAEVLADRLLIDLTDENGEANSPFRLPFGSAAC